MHNIPYTDKGKILFIPDLHWRDIAYPSIRNSLQIQDKIMDDLSQIIVEQGITHIVQMGDWCDKGYTEEEAKYAHERRVTNWSSLVNGNLAMCIGNHMFIQSVRNPEYYWIQPHPKYHTPKRSVRGTPLVKTPDSIRVGGLQISLFHFDRVNKDYWGVRDDDAIYHVGVYHDDSVMPPHVKLKENINTPTPNSYLQKVFENVDHAIFGHIHTKYDTFSWNIGTGKELLVDICGSASITNIKYNHATCRMPVYEIDGNKIKLSYIEQPTYVQELIFSSVDSIKEHKKLLDKSLEAEVLDYKAEALSSQLASLGVMNAHDYLRGKGIPPRLLKLYNKLKVTSLNFDELLKMEVEEINAGTIKQA